MIDDGTYDCVEVNKRVVVRGLLSFLTLLPMVGEQLALSYWYVLKVLRDQV